MTDQRRILALSSSTVGSSGYLEKAMPAIMDFLGKGSLRIAFIPFAFVDDNKSSLVNNVKQAFIRSSCQVDEVTVSNGAGIVQNADVIMVSGGNTFKLLHDLYETGLLNLIKEKVNAGIPYIGWSAGSNITGATICTTNDMPIIEPQSFKALAFFPFQINPHYYNVVTPGFNGETRDQRLEEYIKLNPGTPVIGLPEGTALLLEAGKLRLTGDTNGIRFGSQNGELTKQPIEPGEDISQLLVI
jgi:dipeptidase E